jgi:hypothetical protein
MPRVTLDPAESADLGEACRQRWATRMRERAALGRFKADKGSDDLTAQERSEIIAAPPAQ